MAARTRLTIQQINASAGKEITFQGIDDVNGMQVQNTGRVTILVKTDAGGGVTVAVPSVACIHGRTGDVSSVVAASKVQELGPYVDPTIWGDGQNQLYVDFSALTGNSTNNTIAAVQQS